MYKKPATHAGKNLLLALGATLLLGTVAANSGDAPAPSIQNWIGHEFTIESSTLDDHMPTGGKLTFVFDGTDDVVRICTRSVPAQKGPWRMDFAEPCKVTLSYSAGTRYCSLEDVKTGNAEVLASCHRLRTRDVAMRPSRVKGAAELNDMIVFLLKGAAEKPYIAILVDSPARVTEDGVIVGR